MYLMAGFYLFLLLIRVFGYSRSLRSLKLSLCSLCPSLLMIRCFGVLLLKRVWRSWCSSCACSCFLGGPFLIVNLLCKVTKVVPSSGVILRVWKIVCPTSVTVTIMYYLLLFFVF